MNILKKLSLLIVSTFVALPAFALLDGDGYYRIHNVYTGRYAYIVDNTGSINVQTTTIEAGAIELWPNLDPTLYDPATVLYFEKHGDRWDVKSQQTGIYQMLGTYLGVYADPRNPGSYWAYGTKGSMTAYLWDANPSTIEPESWMTNIANNSYPLCRNWYIDPIDNNTDNYFGLLPTIIGSDGNYAVWFADFSYSFASSGMSAYYITKYDPALNVAVYKHVVGNVPAATPVFVKCAGTAPAQNKVNIGASASPVQGNILKGVWFNCKKYNHDNRVVNDKATMRVLKVLSDGTVGFGVGSFPVTPQDKKECLPRNSFYLQVPEGSPEEIHMVSEAEYEEMTRVIEAETVTLNTTSLTLTEGDTAQLTATVLPDNTTDKTVTYTSSNEAVATVDANGKVTAVAPGTATITAKCGNASATCSVTVKQRIIEATSVTLNYTSLTLTEGETAQLTAIVSPDNTTDKTVTYASSNTAVATVDATGKVSAVAPGTATITARCGNATATCAVTVNKLIIEPTAISLSHESITIKMGETATLEATVMPANTTDPTLTFASGDASVATVDNTGKISGIAIGETDITVSCGAVSAVCHVTVLTNVVDAETVALNVAALEMTVDDTYTLVASVLPADTTDPTVTFSSLDHDVAVVDQNGVVTAVGGGETDIYARCGSAFAVCHVKVGKLAQAIVWDQEFTEIYEGQEIELAATATSGLDVAYTITEGADIAIIVDGKLLKVLFPGTITVKAYVDETSRYEAAEPVTKTIVALSGICDAIGDNSGIRFNANGITVGGEYAGETVEVYSTDGALVYRGRDAMIALPRATYIIRVAGKTYKARI